MLFCLSKQKELSADSSFLLGKRPMAEKVGFEPTSHFRDYLISSEGRYDHFDTSPCIFSIGFPTKNQMFTCLNNCEQAVSTGSIFLLSEMSQTLYSYGFTAIVRTHNRVDFESGSL